MRHIQKGPEPHALTQYRNRPGARYDGDNAFPPVKQAIREALVTEQRGLCCYCNQRILASESGMRVEHRVPQSADRSRDLEWRNLLGACRGNEGPGPTHCDVAKGDQQIEFDPTLQAHAVTAGFKGARVTSSNASFAREFDAVLGLNVELLVRNRDRALDEFIAAQLGRRAGGVRRETFERWLVQLEATTPLPPFASYLAWWLRREIRKRGG